MTEPRPLPSSLGENFSTRDALTVGATRRRLRAQDLDQPFHGARRLRPVELAEEEEREDEDDPGAIARRKRDAVVALARSYLPVMPRGAFFCGLTAAVLHDAPIDHGAQLQVAAFAPAHGPKGKGISSRRIAPHLASVTQVDGLPVTDVPTTWAMLASDATQRELVVVGDSFVRIPRSDHGVLQPAGRLCTIDELRAVATGRRHARELRAAVDEIRVGSASPLETEYRLDAAAYGMPEPELDVEIRDGNGRLLGITEIAYPQYRVLVEIEGDHHRTSRKQWNRDIQKYRDYEDAGWRVVRLTGRDVRSTRGVVLVTQALLARGWRGEKWAWVDDLSR